MVSRGVDYVVLQIHLIWSWEHYSTVVALSHFVLLGFVMVFESDRLAEL